MAFLYETHMHTSQASGCAVSTAAEQVRAYKKEGYTGIIVTDHFLNGNTTCPTSSAPWDVKIRHFYSGYDSAKAEGDICGLDVFFGLEYSIQGLDFLTYGLDLDFLLANPDMDKLSIYEYSELIRSYNGYIAQAHPYRKAYYISHGFPVDWRLLDGLEVYNSADTDKANKEALAYAKKHDLALQAGSDSHNENHSHRFPYSGISLKSKASDIHEIINSIKDKEVGLII